MSPEAAHVVKCGWNLLLSDFSDVFLGQVLPVFHFPGLEVLRVSVDRVALLITGLSRNSEPGICQEKGVLSGRVNVAEKMDVRGKAILKFKTPKPGKARAVLTFQALDKGGDHFFQGFSIHRPGVVEATAELRFDEVARVAADEEHTAAACLGEVENLGAFASFRSGGLKTRLFDLEVVVVDLKPVGAIPFSTFDIENFGYVEKRAKAFKSEGDMARPSKKTFKRRRVFVWSRGRGSPCSFWERMRRDMKQ